MFNVFNLVLFLGFTNMLENFKRIHNMLRSTGKLLLERAMPSADVSPDGAAGQADGKGI